MSISPTDVSAPTRKTGEPLIITFDNKRPAPLKTLYSKKTATEKGAANYSSTVQVNQDNKALLTEKELKEQYKNCYDGLKDPYTEDEKRIMHDNYRRDGASRRALDFLGEFTLGERTDLTMRPTQAFATEDQEEAATADLMQDPANVDLLNELAAIDERVGLNDHLNAMFISGRHFGRSVLVKQYDKDGLPIRLIPLASIRLGKIYVDSETWELIGIQYKDYQGEKNILQPKDVIHYEANDYHITPNSKWFGLSDSEALIHIAMSLRVTNEIAVPECRSQNWAPVHIVQFPEVQTTEKLMEYREMIKPGKTMILGKGSVNYTKVDSYADLEKVHKSIEASMKDIFRAYGVPLVVAFQDEQNRATAQAALNQMKVSVLEKMRTTIRNVVEPQWYIPNLQAIMRKKQRQQLGPEPTEEQEEGIIPALERSSKILEVDAETIALPFRPKMVFKDKSVDTFLEKSAALLGWLQAGGLTIPMALDILGLHKEAEVMKAEIERREAKALQSQQIAMQQAPLEPQSQSQQTPPEATTGQQSAIPNFPIAKNPPTGKGLLGGSSLTEEQQLAMAELEAKQQIKKSEITKMIIDAIKELDALK